MHLAVIFSGADTILFPGGGALFILITRYLEICNKTVKREKKTLGREQNLKKEQYKRKTLNIYNKQIKSKTNNNT